MTVPKYKRKESQTEFLKELFQLNVRCGQMIMKKPNKYRQNYGDFLIKQCLRALSCAQEANAIYVSANTKPYMMEKRYKLFHEVIEICNNIPTAAMIFFDLSKEIDGYKDNCTKSKVYFAEKCATIKSLVKGIIESDTKRYKEYTKNK